MNGGKNPALIVAQLEQLSLLKVKHGVRQTLWTINLPTKSQKNNI